jgi:hypothetical protein
MLTAAVRDLHRTYPGKFLTDVRTVSRMLGKTTPSLLPFHNRSLSSPLWPVVEKYEILMFTTKARYTNGCVAIEAGSWESLGSRLS